MRKVPRQARSRATVEAILTAGARILGESGWPALTTNRAADMAGVSIGSLYQYFPDKTALAAAITHRHYGDVLGVLRAIDDDALTIAEKAARLVDGMIRIHSVDPRLHHVLLHEVPTGGTPDTARSTFEAEYLRRYEMLVGAGARTAAEVLAAAVSGAIHDAARRGTLATPALAQELIELILSYIEGRRRMSAPHGHDRDIRR